MSLQPVLVCKMYKLYVKMNSFHFLCFTFVVFLLRHKIICLYGLFLIKNVQCIKFISLGMENKLSERNFK